MAEQVGTETTRSDGRGADDSPFSDAVDETPTATAGEQDSKEETPQEQQGSGGAEEPNKGEESTTEAQVDDGDRATPAEDLKVVVSIKGGRATIGVQQPSSDPHIESFDDHDLSGLTGELPAVIERARAGWQGSPKHPAYQRPAPPARSRNRRGQGSAQASNANTETEQAQQQTLKLF